MSYYFYYKHKRAGGQLQTGDPLMHSFQAFQCFAPPPSNKAPPPSNKKDILLQNDRAEKSLKGQILLELIDNFKKSLLLPTHSNSIKALLMNELRVCLHHN